MEHESFVPGMTTARLVQALRTPEVVRASLPGWQPDAAADGDGAAVGRLRLRVGGTTITYRGTVTVSDEGPGFTLTAEGSEVRGAGRVTVNALLSVVTAVQPEPGVTLVWRGEAEATGRVAALEPAAVESAVRRLLDRFCADLGANAPAAEVTDPSDGTSGASATSEDAPGTAEAATSDAIAAAQAPEPAGPAAADEPAEPAAKDEPAEPSPAGEPAQPEAPAAADDTPAADAECDAVAGGDAEAPGPGPGPDPDDEPEADVVDDLGEPVPPADLDDFDLVEVEVEVPESAAALDDLVPPAEAAHARRTMIGRSAEEVDHAPPRGRYAPVPAPDSSSAAAALRWAAPVAAALVASAVVVGRVLRRRG